MWLRDNQNIYRSTLLIPITGFVHGFSNRSFGDMRQAANREQFLAKLGLPTERLVRPQQVHKRLVHEVRSTDRGSEITGSDSLVFMAKRRLTDQPILAVFGADCVPILLVDPASGVMGVTHAGWKGTLQAVVTETLKVMVRLGAKTQNILVATGPRIGACCYNIPPERVRAFSRAFPDAKKALTRQDGQWFLDLGYLNCRQLRQAGIASGHIDDSLLCTSCQNQEFFSFRKNGKAGFGEIMGVVTFTS